MDEPASSSVSIDGEKSCPPEDVGGSPGCAEFLAAMADTKHPEHLDLKKSIGGSLEPTALNLAEVNKRLNASD